jgi:hypothetical protein
MSDLKDVLYRRYLDAFEAMSFEGQYMPYNWGRLPNSLPGSWLIYQWMFDEFSREIANSINQLTDLNHRLKAWSAVTAAASEHENMTATFEFVEPLATVGLTLPSVIRSRIIFAVSHLCHQANRARDGISWKDDLPLDTELHFNTADQYGADWQQYSTLKPRLEKVGDKNYQKATHDFRNSYNHRFSPRVVVGVTSRVTRTVNTQTKRVIYGLGELQPLSLELVTDLLTAQCRNCYAAFGSFQNLIREHEECITGMIVTSTFD